MKDLKPLTQKELDHLSYCFAVASVNLHRCSSYVNSLSTLEKSNFKKEAIERLSEIVPFAMHLVEPSHALAVGLDRWRWEFTSVTGQDKYTLHIRKNECETSSLFTLEREPLKDLSYFKQKISTTFDSRELAKEFDKHLLNF